MVSSHHSLVLLSTKDVLLISYFFLFTALAALAALKISKTGEEEEDSKMEEAFPRDCNPPPAWLVTVQAESKLKPLVWGKPVVWGHQKREATEHEPLVGWGLRWRKANLSKQVPVRKPVVPACWKAAQCAAAAASRRGASDGSFQTQSKQQSKRF